MADLTGDLNKVATNSLFFRDYLNSDQGDALVGSGDLEVGSFQPQEFLRRLGDFSELDTQQFDFRLREQRHWEMARIIFRDQSRRSDLVATTADLSTLADTCLQAALDYHFRQLCDDWGEPIVDGKLQQLCVLGLGKLGARELNLSSDIDLIFFYQHSGVLESGKSFQEFYLKLSRALIRSLDDVRNNGNVFRVDMRLRPYGESGSLVLPLTGMEKYYLEQGRDWERYAFIKARAVAGDIEAGEAFLQALVPFIYRKHIDYGALDSLREMKATIDQEVKKKALQDDIKLGPGGIREIEFIVQSQQLIWGGVRPEFRQRRLLEGLKLLADSGLMPTDCIDQLRAAYIFLRNLEHVIQAEQDRQTQALPRDPDSQVRIAGGMGFESYEACLAELNTHRDYVRSIFTDLMTASEEERETLLEGNMLWQQIWHSPDSINSRTALESAGFHSVERLTTLMLRLQQDCVELDTEVAQQINKLVPLLLYLTSREKNSDTALTRMFDLMAAIQRRSTYIGFLIENLDACYRLVRLCAMSEYVASQIVKYPILLYTITDAELLHGNQGYEALPAELNATLANYAANDLEANMDALRTFKHGAVLQVAIHELLGEITATQASAQLTRIAELILTKAVAFAESDLIARYGAPGLSTGEALEVEFAVVAYGKLGSVELGYGSDLDLVFLHGEIPDAETLGEKPIHNRVFYQRLGQRVIHMLTTLTRFGSLYEVDLRLRPDGNSGPLVISHSTYARYLEQAAWTWEQQALVRARMIVGSEVQMSNFAALRDRILRRSRDTQQLLQEVTDMRAKMRAAFLKETEPKETESGETEDGTKSLKQSKGGLVDIEFLVQHLVLSHAASHPHLDIPSDNVSLLANLADAGLVPLETAEILTRAFTTYRQADHLSWLGLENAESSHMLTLRQQVQSVWQAHFGEVSDG